MHIVVLGAGALGSVLGGHLARHGHDVTLVGRGDHVARVRERGLRVEGRVAFTVQVHATTDPREVEGADLLLATTKLRDLPQALEGVPDGVRMAAGLQNGVTKDDLLARRFGEDRVLGALSLVGASRVEAGVVRHTFEGFTLFGERGGSVTPRVQGVVDAFEGSGLRARASDAIVDDEWTKFCQWAAAGVASCLSRLEWHRIWTSRPLAELFVLALREAAAVARAGGHRVRSVKGLRVGDFLDGPLEEAVDLAVERGGRLAEWGATDVKISLLQDLEAGRPTEAEETLGHLLREAGQRGVETPVLEVGYRVIRGIEAAQG